jgi:hypothetical protein
MYCVAGTLNANPFGFGHHIRHFITDLFKFMV